MALGGTIKLQGESEYRRALNQIKQNLREVASEMKIVTSTYDKNDDSIKALTAKQEVLQKRLSEQKDKLNLVTEHYKKFSEAVKKSADEYTELGSKLESAKAKLESIGSQSGKNTEEYQKQKKAVEDLQKQYGKSTDAQDKNKKSLTNLAIEMNNAQADVNKTSNEMKNLGDTTKKVDEGFTVLKGTMANLASEAIKKVAEGAKNIAQQVFEAGSNFEASMSNVKAISGATGDEMLQLKAKAEEMGAKTKFTATEAGDAMSYMAMAGWKTSDMLNGIEGIMNLAAASGEDLATTSDIVTDALTAMGYSAGDAGELADVMAAAASNSNTNVSMMGETFKYAAPLVGALGYNMQDTALAIGLMANSGIKAEQAGTSLRSILTRLASPPKECAAALDDLGISLTDSEGNMLSLKEVMDQLREKFAGLDEIQQTSYANSIAGKNAMSGLLAIVNAAPEDYDKLTEAVNNCSGASEEMANTMNDNVNGQITLLKSKIEGIMIQIFDNASGSIRQAIDKISEALDSIDWTSVADTVGKIAEGIANAFSFIIDNGDTIVSVATGIGTAMLTWAIAEKINAVVDAVKKFQLANEGASVAQALLNGAMNANPIMLVVTLIAGLVSAIMTLWATNDGFREAVTNVWNAFKDVVGGAITNVGEFITNLVTWFSELPGNIGGFLGDVISGVAEWASNMVQKAIEVGSNFITNINNFFNQLPYYIGYAVGWALGKILEFGQNLITFATTTIPEFFNTVVNWFAQLPSNIWNWLLDTINNVGEWGSNMLQSAIEIGSGFLDSVGEFIMNLPSNVWNWLVETINNVAEFASDMASKGAEAASNLKDNIIDGIINLPSRMLEIGDNIVSGIWDGIQNAKDWLIGKITGFASGVVSGFKDALGIHSPSRVLRDQVGKFMAEGIGVGFSDEMKSVTADMQNAIPTNFDVDATANVNGSTGYAGSNGYNYDRLVSAFKEAIMQVKIELDNEEMGHFVDKTVTRLIYA